MSEKKAAKKKAKSKAEKAREKAEAIAKKHAAHVKTLGHDICQKYKEWYERMVAEHGITPCLLSTWIDEAGRVMQMAAYNEDWKRSRPALEAGIEAQMAYFLKKGDETVITLKYLLTPKKMRALIEKGMGIRQTQRRKARPPPGVIHIEHAPPVKKPIELPRSWRHKQVVRAADGRYGIVKREDGQAGIRWVNPCGDYPDLFRLGKLGPVFQGDLDGVRWIHGEEALSVVRTWKRLKEQGRLLEDWDFIKELARRNREGA